jgi:hypothetical protein
LAELRTLIGEMSRANPLWGAPRIHGELLKLGFDVAQSTVARHMCCHSGPPSQGWRTFLSNHADGIAAVDLFVLPTIAFRILYCLVIIRHGRRIWLLFDGFSRTKIPSFYVEGIVSVDNEPSKRASAATISATPTAVTNEDSGLPALQYLRKIE